MARERPLGVTVIGAGLAALSLLQIAVLLNSRPYLYLFQNWPGEFFRLRFAAVWVLRLAGLAAGAGLLAQDDRARKVVLALSWLSILTVYWRYPYSRFLRQTDDLNRALGSAFDQLPVSPATLALWSCIAATVFSTAVAAAVLYYLTRPRIKAFFAPRA